MNTPRSGIRVLMELSQDRPGVSHLEVGQPGYPTPRHVIEAAYQAALDGFTGYTPNAGYPSLRLKLAAQVQDLTGVNTSMENIMVSTGCMQAINASLTALVESGDEVLIPNPGYPNYTIVVQVLGAVPVYYDLLPEESFRPDFDSLRRAVTPRTKVLIVNSPSNPTGAVFSRLDMERLVEFAQENDLFLLSDESYDRIVFDGEHVSPRIFDPSRVVACYSFSKTYSMAGWRVGYAVAPAELSQLLAKLQETSVACTSSVSQKAAEAAIDGPQEIIAEMVAGYKANRDLAVAISGQAGVPVCHPPGTFYLLVDIRRSGLDSYAFARQALEKASVVVAPGDTFGSRAGAYVRVSFAVAPNELDTGMRRLVNFINQFPDHQFTIHPKEIKHAKHDT
jgi:aspartate aminotransferase/aminotransferase